MKPIIRKAGGLQALVSQIDSVEALIERAGGLHELEELVSDTYLLQISVEEAGGLQGLHNLMSEVKSLRRSRDENLELLARVSAAEQHRSKALKYDQLEHIFTQLSKGQVKTHPNGQQPGDTAALSTQDTSVAANTECSQYPREPPVDHPSTSLVVIDAPRASRIASMPLDKDPDGDLYGARPLVEDKLSRKRRASGIPIDENHITDRRHDQTLREIFLGKKPFKKMGSRQEPAASFPQSLLKQEIESPPADSSKRRRVDVGRASALVPASLSGTDSITQQSTPEASRPHSGRFSSDAVGSASGDREIMMDEAMGRNSTASSRHEPHLKTERNDRTSIRTQIATSLSSNYDPRAKVRKNNPMALWIGSRKAAYVTTGINLKQAWEIPSSLGHYLIACINYFVGEGGVEMWDSTPCNSDVCILGWMVDDRKPSRLLEESRACSNCCMSVWGNQRPCAVLLGINGVPTLVFMPLKDEMRLGASWTEKRYWVLNG